MKNNLEQCKKFKDFMSQSLLNFKTIHNNWFQLFSMPGKPKRKIKLKSRI